VAYSQRNTDVKVGDPKGISENRVSANKRNSKEAERTIGSQMTHSINYLS